MCGIIGCIGIDDAADQVLNGLKNLEYRGYDSAGVAVKTPDEIVVRKQAGKISELKNGFAHSLPEGNISIGHTRWSTHGPPTDENAHPHTSNSERVAVVHNGIISNYESLRERCRRHGYRFTSDTDTEVVAHLIEWYLDSGETPEAAFEKTVADLEGSYALSVLIDGTQTVYAAREGSPLVLGLNDSGYYLASDVPAFLEHTDRVVYLQDGDVLAVSPDDYSFLERGGSSRDRPVEMVEWDAGEAEKGAYDHFMLKEIEEQPNSLSDTIEGRADPGTGTIDFESFPSGRFSDIREIHLVACGTSFHAAMYGSRVLNDRGIRANPYRASQYDDSVPIDEDTLVLAVTQSGETADTLSALKTASRKGARTFAVTNVVGSTVSREADSTVYIRAGPEIGVAATKTFSSQVVTLTMLAEQFAAEIDGASTRDDPKEFVEGLLRLPSQIDDVLATSRVTDLCERYTDQEEYFFIGHGLGYPVALEGALKYKEITYEHAEGFTSGELKHGPLALVTHGVPVFAIFTGENDERTRINATEAQSRGAHVIAIASEGVDAEFADEIVRVPNIHPDLNGLLANVMLQLVSYYAAKLLDRPIDKPRNLAKSVTVN